MRNLLKRSLPPQVCLILVAAAAAFMLSVALVAQYGFSLHPCELCLLQRYPYAAIVALGLLGAALIQRPSVLWLIAGLCGLLFLADAGIAAYHAGVELGLFPGPTACSSAASQGETLEEMRRAILNAPLVACDQAMVHVLGISMAGWNAVAASLLSIGTFAILYNRKKLS